MGHRIIAALGVALSCIAVSTPMEAHAQFGGYGGIIGNVIGGAVAGSIIANSQPRTVYVRSRIVYARPRVTRPRTRIVYARPAPHRAIAGGVARAATPAATINANADPFATAKPGSLVPIASKP